MIEMVRRFLRQKFGSIGVVIALAVLSLLTTFQGVFQGEAALDSGGFLALLILAAGSVSKDVSSGALQMILARPIRRVEYLFGRYCGILTAYTLYVLATGLLLWSLLPVVRRLLGADAVVPVSAGALARGAAGALLSAALLAAVLLFFSTFLRGYGDVLAYLLVTLAFAAPDILAARLGKPWLSRLGALARENLLPHVTWREVLTGRNVLSAAVGEYVLAVTGYLFLAALIFSRREFSYGQD